MVKAVALNAVHVCLEPGAKNEQGKVTKRAKIEVIPPGKIFDCSDEDFATFKEVSAAREATKADLAVADKDGQLPVEPAKPSETNAAKAK